MTTAADNVPLPTRPGTLWDPIQGQPFGLRCRNCGEGLSRHGAPEGVVKELGLPAETERHLVCPASRAAWDEFNYQRRVATYEDARAEVVRALNALKGHDASVPLDQVVALLPTRPEWTKP